MNTQSVADLLGPWVDPHWDSGLIERLRRSWNIPIGELSNELLATFLRQQIAIDAILEEAKARLEKGFDDTTELYERELEAAVREACERNLRGS